MNCQTFRCLALATVLAAFSIASPVAHAATGSEHLAQGHTQFASVVTKKSGALVVTTPNGAIHQLNANMGRRHGQEPFKAGTKSSSCWTKTTTSSTCISKGKKARIDR